MSNLRSQRFTDTNFASDPRSYNQPHPFASKSPPDFASVKNLLAEERKNSKLYDEVWKAAQTELQHKKSTLSPDYFKPSTPDECYTAIIAYTLDTQVNIGGQQLQLYSDFNRRFRGLSNEASWNDFPYKSFYYLMQLALPGVKNKPEINRRLYRGISNIFITPDPRVGDNFYFDYLASCSTDRTTAEEFMGPRGTMVELEDGATVAAGLDAYSPFDEEEVLVFPKNKFRITKFEKSGNKHRLVVRKA